MVYVYYTALAGGFAVLCGIAYAIVHVYESYENSNRQIDYDKK